MRYVHNQSGIVALAGMAACLVPYQQLAAAAQSPHIQLAQAAVVPSAGRVYDFSSEAVGAEPKSFIPVVGYWTIGVDGGNKVLAVDGRKWSQGQASVGLADKARAIYGERYAEFLDNVSAYAYYPYAVARDTPNFSNGTLSVRFKAISGRIDQAAGILFNLKPNGDYLTLRAHSLENNLVLWRVVRGKRTSLKWIRDVPTASRRWHELRITINGRNLSGYLDGRHLMDYRLSAPVSGKVGVWSKADSYVDFDDFRVVPAG